MEGRFGESLVGVVQTLPWSYGERLVDDTCRAIRHDAAAKLQVLRTALENWQEEPQLHGTSETVTSLVTKWQEYCRDVPVGARLPDPHGAAYLEGSRDKANDLASTIAKLSRFAAEEPVRGNAKRSRRHDERSAALRAEAASSAAAASTQRAVLAHAKLLRRGLDALDDGGWRDFLVKLVEKVVIGPDAIDLHLVLPAAQADSQRSNQASSSSSTRARSGAISFSSSW